VGLGRSQDGGERDDHPSQRGVQLSRLNIRFAKVVNELFLLCDDRLVGGADKGRSLRESRTLLIEHPILGLGTIQVAISKSERNTLADRLHCIYEREFTV
jgi:hypothetical protein